MICEVDESLCALLVASVPEGTLVSLEPEGTDGRDPEAAGQVRAVLGTIRQDVTGLPANWSDLRDDEGTVIARRPPIQRYELRYRVTARAASATEEHALLDAILTAVTSAPGIEQPHLHSSFTSAGQPVLIRVGEPVPEPWPVPDRAPGLDLVLTAPLLTEWIGEVTAPPAEFQLDASAGRPTAATAAARPPRPLRARRIREGG